MAKEDLALVDRPRLRTAGSLAGARPGETLIVDPRGNVISPARLRALRIRRWAVLSGVTAALGIAWGVILSPAMGILYVAAAAGATWYGMRRLPRYHAAVALVSAQRWEEAHAALSAMQGSALPRGLRHGARVTLATVDWLLGRPEAALTRLDEALAQPGVGPDAALARFRARCVRARILATMGKLDEARRQRAEIGPAGGDYYELVVQLVDLALAFEADAPGELPDDATLHEWARAALGRTQFGEQLVYLAWAFHRRGDEEMARHLLGEAPERIPRDSLAATAPRLSAWANAMREKWSVERRT